MGYGICVCREADNCLGGLISGPAVLIDRVLDGLASFRNPGVQPTRLQPETPRVQRPPGSAGKSGVSELLHLNIQDLNPIGNLPGRHPQNPRGLGLHPARLLQGGDDPFPFRDVRVAPFRRSVGR